MKKNQKMLVGAIAVMVLMIAMKMNQKAPEPPQVVVSATPTPSVAPPVEKVEVLYARKTIPRYTFLDSSNLTDLMIQRKGVPRNILPTAKLARAYNDVKGFIVLDDIARDEPVVLDRLARPGEIGGVSFHIRKGFRGVTVRIDKVRGVAGFVNQGDKVDLLGTFTVEGKPLTRYILQNVTILAVNSTFENPDAVASSPPPGEPAPPSPQPGKEGQEGQAPRDRVVAGEITLVTFEVPPQDAEKLILASGQARLYMALRSPGDLDSKTMPPVDDKDLYLAEEHKPPVQKINIHVWKGPAPRPSIAPVRLEGEDAGSRVPEGLNIYLDLEEEPIRDIKESDFAK